MCANVKCGIFVLAGWTVFRNPLFLEYHYLSCPLSLNSKLNILITANNRTCMNRAWKNQDQWYKIFGDLFLNKFVFCCLFRRLISQNIRMIYNIKRTSLQQIHLLSFALAIYNYENVIIHFILLFIQILFQNKILSLTSVVTFLFANCSKGTHTYFTFFV